MISEIYLIHLMFRSSTPGPLLLSSVMMFSYISLVVIPLNENVSLTTSVSACSVDDDELGISCGVSFGIFCASFLANDE